jgi:hypothetical protein
MKFFAVMGLAGLLALGGCRSAFVEVKVVNGGLAPVSIVEMDYPNGSFGVDSLEGSGTYHYRFKILGSGPAKLMWTDAARRDYSSVGPQLHEGEQGTMTVTILGGTAEWETDLKP